MKPSEKAIDKIHNIFNEHSNDVSSFYDKFDGVGICLSCAALQDGAEPDAEGYHCNDCGEDAVMGVETAVISY